MVVNALPVVTQVSDFTVCSGSPDNINVGLSSDQDPDVSYSWTVNNVGADTTGGAGGTGSTITQTLSNSGVTTQTIDYVVTATNTVTLCGSTTMTFTVTVNPTPDITPLGDQVACDSYVLPAIGGTNLTGNEAYYTGTGGTGTQYNAGDLFTDAGTTTLYIYDETGTTPNCFDEESFTVTINLTPDITPLGDQVVCDSYVLPAIGGTNLTGCLLYTSPSPRDATLSRMPSSA